MTKVSERKVLSCRRKQLAGEIRERLDAEGITYYGLVSKTQLINYASTTTLQNESIGVVTWTVTYLDRLIAEYHAAPEGNNRLPEHPAYQEFKHALLDNWIDSLSQFSSSTEYAVRNSLAPNSLSRVKNKRTVPTIRWFADIADYKTPVLVKLNGQQVNINSPEGYMIAHDLATVDFIKTVNRRKLTRCGQRAININGHIWMVPLSKRLTPGTKLPGSLDVLLNLLANTRGKLEYSFGETSEDTSDVKTSMMRLNDALANENMSEAIAVLRPLAKRHSYTKLAEDVGLSVDGVYRFFAGDTEPSYRTFMRVLKALGLKMTIEGNVQQ